MCKLILYVNVLCKNKIQQNSLIIFYTLIWMLTWESNICFSFFLYFFNFNINIYVIVFYPNEDD